MYDLCMVKVLGDILETFFPQVPGINFNFFCILFSSRVKTAQKYSVFIVI